MAGTATTHPLFHRQAVFISASILKVVVRNKLWVQDRRYSPVLLSSLHLYKDSLDERNVLELPICKSYIELYTRIVSTAWRSFPVCQTLALRLFIMARRGLHRGLRVPHMGFAVKLKSECASLGVQPYIAITERDP